MINNTKKIMMIFLAISMLALAGCGESEEAKKEEKKAAREKAAQERYCKEFPRTATGCK